LGIIRIGAILLLATIAPCTFAKSDPIYTTFFSPAAVGGYDPVAYFTEGKPVEGDTKFTFEYKGAEFRFSSKEHLAAFKADPEKYTPRYGGYCAWAVGQGHLAKGDPKYWRIVDGKLYLNFDEKVQKTWESDIPGFIRRADRNWPRVLE